MYDVSALDYTAVSGYVGLDHSEYNASYGSVQFQVLADNKVIYDSGVMDRKDAMKKLDAAIPAGTQLITLRALKGENDWNDHADWADIMFTGTFGDNTADYEAADAVDAKINAIGTVTLDSEAKITQARQAYEALTPEQKALVTKLDVLETAEARLAELKADKPFTVAGTSVVLGNSLEMRFAVNVADLKGNTNVYALVTKYYADNTPTVTAKVPYLEWAKPENGQQTVSFKGIAAKEMADRITVQIFDQTTNEALSELYTTSIQEYARKILDNPENSREMHTVVVDMLNYGAAAQVNFKYNTAHPANSILSEAEQALATQETTAVNHLVPGANYVTTTLSLDNSLLLNLYFKDITPDMEAELTYTDHYGISQLRVLQSHEFHQDNASGMMAVPLDMLALPDGRAEVKCVIKSNHGQGPVVAEVTDSVESYAARVLKSSKASPELKTLVTELMKFVDSSTRYFASLPK